MKIKFATTLLLLLLIAAAINGQVPLIKSNSGIADIRDGLHYKKSALTITPDAKANKYYIELPHRDHRVVLYTDLDSIRFDISFGGVYNFAVLLNGKDTCFVQLMASPEKLISFKGKHPDTDIPDTIPFTIASNNKIYVKGNVGSSENVNLLVDLGASDSKSQNENVLSGSTVEIAGLHWDSVTVRTNAVGNAKATEGVIDNSLFQDKVVKIDYDNRQIILYETMPLNDTGYSRHEMIMDGSRPMIQAGIATKDTTLMNWFVLGTGDQRNGFIDETTASKYNLYKGSNRYLTYQDRVFVKLPEFRIANVSFMNVAAIIAKNGTHKGESSVLGNGLLKRFNVILDNRNGYIFLKPNSLRTAPFDNTFLIIYGAITGVVIVLLIIIGLIVRSVRRRNLRRHFTAPDYNNNISYNGMAEG
ncbi:MAG: hypothetical protein QM764_23855 [Chitinophagaceae bacterium]